MAKFAAILTCTLSVAWMMACSNRPGSSPKVVVAIPVQQIHIAELSLQSIVDADFVDDRRILVAGEDGVTGIVCSTDGSFRRVGGHGSGPGEFRQVSSVSSDGASGIVVADGALRKISWLDGAGHLIDEVSTPGVIIGGIWPIDSGVVVKTMRGGANGTQMNMVTLDTAQSRVSLSPWKGVPDLFLCLLCFMSISRDGSMAIAASATSYQVERMSAIGETLASIRSATFKPVRLTAFELDSAAQMRAALAPRMRASGLSDSSVRRLLTSYVQPTSKTVFVAGGMHYDNEGNLWLQRSVARAEGAEADVFDARGVAVATIQLPPGFRLLRIRGAMMLGIVASDDDGDDLLLLSNPLVAGTLPKRPESPRSCRRPS